MLGFNSSMAISDFDAVLIDAHGVFNGEKLHPAAVVHRREEFLEFLELGKVVVVFAAREKLDSFLPVSAFSVTASSGRKMDFNGAGYLKSFWESVCSDMQYLGYSNDIPGHPFLFVSETKKPVGSILRHNRGTILFLPFLSPENQANERNFLTALEQLCGLLSSQKEKEKLPDWSTNYGWHSEQALRADLSRLQTEAESIAKRIGAATESLIVEERLKILFTGKGDALEETAATVFRELGFEAARGEPGRDDIVLEFGGKKAVAEVKGKKGSAAEKDAAQLEKWVAGFVEEKGKSAKGILLVNAFCEMPLSDRNEPAFPHQMLKYSTQREHCLITTTQLLGLLLETRSHPERRDELVEDLFATVGVYPKFTDWRMFLLGPPAADSAKV